jgi:hypothetical protein
LGSRVPPRPPLSSLLLQFGTSASASVKIIYEYTGAVPTEDATWSELESISR